MTTHTYGIYNSKQAEPLRPMTVRLGTDGKTYRIITTDCPNVEEQEAYLSKPKEAAKKQSRSTKLIQFARPSKEGHQNKQKAESKDQRQINNIKMAHQKEMRHLVEASNRQVREMEGKYRALQRERDHWKDMAIKQKEQLQLRDSKPNVIEKSATSMKQASSAHQLKQYEEQIKKLKYVNSLLVSDIMKLKQENRRLAPAASSLEKRLQMEASNRSQSPARSVGHLGQRIPKGAPRHRGHTSDSNWEAMRHQLIKQVERVKKTCAKLEAVVQERNQQIARLQIAALDMKYR